MEEKRTADSGQCSCCTQKGHCHDHDHGHGHDHDHDHDHGHSHGCGCGCGHNHGESEGGGKRLLIRLGVALVLAVAAALMPIQWAQVVLFAAAYLTAGYDVLLTAAKNIVRGRVFDENFLMTVASLGAFILGDYLEAVAVLLLYGLGEYFQDLAVNRSRRSISALMDIRPETAVVLRDGSELSVHPSDVAVGERIVVRPGERIPLDGIVVRGETQLDTSALTGESVPANAGPGDAALSGSIVLNGLVEMEVTKGYGESTVAKILEMVEHAAANKAPTERFITRFARVYTPIVCGLAVLICIVPTLILGPQVFGDYVYTALTFLIISCPCALVISVPLGFFAGIGKLSKQGVLVKGSDYLEMLALARTAVFDKTGTLTTGRFTVEGVYPAPGFDASSLAELAAIAESRSNHPMARAIAGNHAPVDGEYEEIAGHGVRAVFDGRTVLAGSPRLMEKYGVATALPDAPGAVLVAVDGAYAGYIVVADSIKPTTAGAIARLKSLGITRTVMLTGDSEEIAGLVAEKTGVGEYRAKMLPADKVSALGEIMADGGKTIFVGDGINDAPVLASADVGVAMGGLGSDAAIESADAVIMDDDLARLADAVITARRTRTVVRQNIVFALGVKFAIMILGVFGISSMWSAIFADVGVALLCVFNSLRVYK